MTASRVAFLAACAALVAGCGLANSDQNSDSKTTSTATTATTKTQTTSTSTTATSSGVEREGGAGSALAETGAPAAAGLGSIGSSGLVRPFADNSPWNVTVDGQPVDPKSDTYIRLAQERQGVVERGDTIKIVPVVRPGGLFINTARWTVPIVDEEGGEATKVVCRQIKPNCGDGSTVNELLIPPGESPFPQYDGWFTVLNRQQGVAYDMWRARRGDGADSQTISYQFMRKWDLNGPGFQVPNGVSARGSGLPLFAGVILPEEIEAGRIDHALAISLPGPAQRNYVQPASATDGNGRLTSIPEGARIRLRPGVSFASLRGRTDPACDDPDQVAGLSDAERKLVCSAYRFPSRTNKRAAVAIITALRTYGAIVVDRSRVPTLYAKQNFNWRQPLRAPDGRLLGGDGKPLPSRIARLGNQSTPLLRGNEIQGLRISDFQVIKTGQIYKFPPNSTEALAPRTSTPSVP